PDPLRGLFGSDPRSAHARFHSRLARADRDHRQHPALDLMARPLLLVTGMAEGLGAAIATAFARAGHDVIGLRRSDRAAAKVQAMVAQAGGVYTHLACDVTQADDVTRALGPIADRVDVFVHNAHVLLIKPFAETTPVEFEHVWRVACLGAMTAAQTAIPHMAA